MVGKAFNITIDTIQTNLSVYFVLCILGENAAPSAICCPLFVEFFDAIKLSIYVIVHVQKKISELFFNVIFVHFGHESDLIVSVQFEQSNIKIHHNSIEINFFLEQFSHRNGFIV